MKLNLNAELVLSGEFCGAPEKQVGPIKQLVRYSQGWNRHDSVRMHEMACLRMENDLAGLFADLRRVETISPQGSTLKQLSLIPRFLDDSATEPLTPFGQRDLVIEMEWSAIDPSGKTIWLQTVQGTAQRKRGLVYSKKRDDQLIADALQDLFKASALKMADAPELRKLEAHR